jgi:hypothetical protein
MRPQFLLKSAIGTRPRIGTRHDDIEAHQVFEGTRCRHCRHGGKTGLGQRPFPTGARQQRMGRAAVKIGPRVEA